MYIKNIVISGFRSYREQPFPEELSPKHNVVVGRNGSGKSNFFAAVQFVLSEKFANLRANERKELFHVGAGRPSFSIYVEIVFDNSDGRLVLPHTAVEQDEVTIRRTLGLKQDEFRVNDRRFTATEVRQLLESAGFSASNPYYIVEQGKIVHLAHLREDERYQLLKDVAGTKVYEARRAESEAILHDTEDKSTKIDENVAQLDERLAQLEAETSELKQFQDTDKRRRCLEFSVYSAEIARSKADLDKLDTTWAQRLQSTDAQRSEQDQLEADARASEVLANLCGKRLAELESERKTLEKERMALANRRAVATLRAEEASGVTGRDTAERKALDKESKDLTKAIDKAGKDAEAKKAVAAQRHATAEASTDKLTQLEIRLSTLQAKRGRKSQFKTQADRDAWLTKEIERNETVAKQNAKDIKDFEGDAKGLEAALQQEKVQFKKAQTSASDRDTETAKIGKKRDEFLIRRDKFGGERRKLWQKIHDQERQVRRANDTVDRCRQKYERSVRYDIRQGLQSLEECLTELNDPKLRSAVHGRVIDLMRVDEGYTTAVEVTAGNTLFNVVVDSFDVSSRLLAHMNSKKKPGRVTFFPLDTCNTVARNLPTTADGSPLLSHVRFESKFKHVFSELFGRTLVVRTLEAGAAAVRDLDSDAITVDGDQFNRKGGITGGFLELRSKIGAVGELEESLRVAAREKTTLDELLQNVAGVEQQITQVMQDIDAVNSQERSAGELGREEARTAQENITRLTAQLEKNSATRRTLKHTIDAIPNTIAALRAEKQQGFQQAMSAAEERELEQLQNEVSKLRAETTAQQTASVQASTDHQLLQDTHQHLEHRLHAVQSRLDVLGQRSGPGDAMLQKEVDGLTTEVKSLEDRLAAIDTSVEAELQGRRKHEDAASSSRRKALDVSRTAQDQKDAVDRMHTQRALLQQKKEEAHGKIRKLGVVPSEASSYSEWSMGKLLQHLKSTNAELKKYEHVNKKALDQYAALHDSRSDLKDKQNSLGDELESIKKLMAHLDQQKGEAIQRTYKQVQFHFEDVFKDLVRAEGCSADMQLIPNSDTSSSDPFSGVRIEVCFGGGNGTQVAELAQLSGGQKSLVALSLIFAIQRSDPAPFYLFDEIDAALDAEYRSSVARMLQQQSEECQFITASFKTEMLDVADQVYGIFFANKVSRIEVIDKAEGARILKQAAQDERNSKRQRDDDENE